MNRRGARALVIEVTTGGATWTAMAHEEEGVWGELQSAPVADSITIYEWHLAKPVNPERSSPFSQCPQWVFTSKYPWKVGR